MSPSEAPRLFAGKAKGRVRVTSGVRGAGMGEVRVSEGVQGILTHWRARESVRACSGTLEKALPPLKPASAPNARSSARSRVPYCTISGVKPAHLGRPWMLVKATLVKSRVRELPKLMVKTQECGETDNQIQEGLPTNPACRLIV